MPTDKFLSRILLTAFSAAVACSNPDARRAADTQAPTASPAAAASESYVAFKACPFECCRYGDWQLRTAATLLRDRSPTSDSLDHLRAETRIVADSGIVIVDPVGLAVITKPPRRFMDTTALPVGVGDTLQLLDYIGEGITRVRARDSIFTVDFLFDSVGTHGARLIRAPKRSWWVHVRAPRAGWILMDSVRVRGADACGG